MVNMHQMAMTTIKTLSPGLWVFLQKLAKQTQLAKSPANFLKLVATPEK